MGPPDPHRHSHLPADDAPTTPPSDFSRREADATAQTPADGVRVFAPISPTDVLGRPVEVLPVPPLKDPTRPYSPPPVFRPRPDPVLPFTGAEPASEPRHGVDARHGADARHGTARHVADAQGETYAAPDSELTANTQLLPSHAEDQPTLALPTEPYAAVPCPSSVDPATAIFAGVNGEEARSASGSAADQPTHSPRPTRVRAPLASLGDLLWIPLAILATALGLVFLTVAAVDLRPHETVTQGAVIYTAIGLVLFAVTIALAGFSPLGALIAGLALAAPGVWWLLEPAAAADALGFATDQPLLVALPVLLSSGIALLWGGSAVVVAIMTGATRLIGRRPSETPSSLRWLVLPACLALTLGGGAVLALGNHANSAPPWLTLGGCAAGIVAAALAKVAPGPAVLGGALLPIAAGAVILAAAGGWLTLPAQIAARFGDQLGISGLQLLALGFAVVGGAIGGRLGRLPSD